MPRRRPVRPAAILFLAALSALSALSVAEAEITERHQRFLDDAAALMSPAESEAFASLQRDHHRDLFIQAFWDARDPFPESPRNEFLERWNENLALARQHFDDLSDPRALAILFLGPQTRSFRPSCSELLQPLEVWVFDAEPGMRPDLSLVFLRQGADRVRAWAPGDGLWVLRAATAPSPGDEASGEDLLTRIPDTCTRGSDLVSALSRAADLDTVTASIGRLEGAELEWVDAFLERTTDVADDARRFPARLSWSFPGRHQSRTVVQMTAAVDAADLEAREFGGHSSYNVLLDGEVLRDGRLFESFRYKFDLPTRPGEAPLPIAVQRFLRPGRYEWIVRLQDLNADAFFRHQEELEIPNVAIPPRDSPAGSPPSVEAEFDPTGALEFWSESNALSDGDSGDHRVELTAPPNDQPLTGPIRVSARAAGENIARVAFELDGRRLLSKASPPYEIEINLGRSPRQHRLSGLALAADGAILARDEILINGGPHRFSVRLIEPLRGRRYTRSVRARAEIEVPQTETLERVEFYLNDDRIATLYQGPFVVPIAIPPDLELGYVRAIGYLEDGNSTEDLVFVNSPHPIDEVDVDLVELYVSVFDSKGRPADDVTADDFRVREGGEEQVIRRFESVDERPIHAGVLLDVSTSMSDSLEEAEKAALHFFESVIRPRDRACLLTFNERPQLVIPFTNDISLLAGGLAGLVPEGDTALHDSLIYALHSFAGLRGRKALVLISDGEDSSSDYGFEEVLEYSRRAGVAIYTVGLRISNREIQIRNKLMRLARDSGGSSFFIMEARELRDVYDKVETELRSQFLIAYQSTSVGDRDQFRKIDVDLLKKGRKAKTLQGYYP